MDSMRTLNTSLPASTSPSKQAEPPEQLLRAFKAAALSVTNLYKSAAADQGRARLEGYQDALDELLGFLDKENIGLNDGEGWRIRRWATERLDGRDLASQNIESDEETEKADRGLSPVLQRSQSVTRLTPSHPVRTASPVRTESAPPSVPPQTIEESTSTVIPQTTFTFRSTHSYPQDADIILADLETSENGRTQVHDNGAATSHGASAQTVGLAVPRATRARHNIPRHNTRTSNAIGRGAGQKRKINFGEFFDIGDFGGGGKRGKFI